MMNYVRRVAAFYLGWRLPLLLISVTLGSIGLAVDSWWAAVIGIAGLLPLLALYALTALRVGAQDKDLADHRTRLTAVETRLAHAEERSTATENRFEAIDKKLKAVTSAAARPMARQSATPPGAPTASSQVVTGQIMALHRLASGRDQNATEPLVTVVIPCFNDSAFVADTIRSVKEQTFSNFACIVIDDCSTDESVAVISKSIKGDKRFHLVRHAVNSGLSTTRNTGLRLAETEYVCFLDSDDFFFVDNLEERVRHLIGYVHDKTTVGVFSGVEPCGEHVRFGDVGPSSRATMRNEFHDHLSAAGSCPFNAHAPLMRTELLQRFGGFDETMRNGAEDWELWQRIMRHGYVFQATPSILAVYRQKARSMVRSMPGLHLVEAAKLLGKVNEPLDPAETLSGTPYVFDEPIGTYQSRLQMAERVLQFVGMVHMTGDAEQIDATFDQLDPSFWPVVERHLKVSALLDVGIRRGFALDLESYRHLDGKIFPIRDELLERLETFAAFDESSAQTAEDAQDPTIDVLFAPENAAQALDMAAAADQLPSDLSTAVLEVNVLTGASGVAEALDDVWHHRRIGLNNWMLGGHAAHGVVVQWPYGPTISSILEQASSAGSATIELTATSSTIARLDESPSVECRHVVSNATEIAAALSVSATLVAPPRRSSVAVAALSAIEEYPELSPDSAGMAAFKDRHVGERCVIIGNGPSLNDLELGRLRDENTIGVNGIFYAEALDFPLTYYVVEDTSVMEENLEAIKTYEAGHKFFPTIYREMYKTDEQNVTFFTMNRGFYAKESPNFCIPRFSTDASQRVFCGQSVTIINLQLAYFMGFTEVYLIGMDFSYTIPDSAEREGDLITSTEDDPNHFHKDYFGKGKTWKDPKLDRVMNNYQLAKTMFEANGRTIYNATAGGKLEIFPRADFHDVFKG
jgi:hypothetical protein